MDRLSSKERLIRTFQGEPIDCTRLLPFGSKEEVKNAVVQAIRDADERKIIIGSTSEIHPQVKVENALAMYESARNYPIKHTERDRL